jgi:predicted RNA-binding Zn ribbon-like protein
LNDGTDAAVAAVARLGLHVEPLAPHQRRRLDSIRTLLRGLGRTLADGRRLTGSQLKALNAVIGRIPVRAQLEVADDGRYLVDFTAVGGSWFDRLERELAGSFTAMIRRSHPSRLKLCEDPDCRTFFYDESRNRARRWCDSRRCGNRARVRRHRQRAGAGTTSS